jgi:hypothetical protein
MSMITIQPVNFHIPPDIQSGLASGDLIRYGGVVRDGAGQLVKHLKEVPLSESGRDAAQRLAASLKRENGQPRRDSSLGTTLRSVSIWRGSEMARSTRISSIS